MGGRREAWRPLAPVIRGVESCYPALLHVAADEAYGIVTAKAVTHGDCTRALNGG